MCQLQHPNIAGAEDIYLPSDIPVERRDSALRLQMRRSSADHICVRMPYYPADMAWLIHSSAQVLTPEHVQVMSCLLPSIAKIFGFCVLNDASRICAL
jgi:hypothetical protein